MKIKILTVAVASALMTIVAHGADQDEYCVTAYSVPGEQQHYASEVREYEPMVVNDFNRKTYELPVVDGEVHIKRDSDRYKLMAQDFGKESLYVVRHADINNNRFAHPDIAFLAETADKPSVVVDQNYAMVLTKSTKRNTVNIKQVPLNDRGYQGRVQWDEIEAQTTILGEFVEFEFETAITVNNKPYALVFTKTKSKNLSSYDFGAVLIDLQNPNRYRYTVLYSGKNTKPLNGNAMYVNHYKDTVMINVFDRMFKIKG